MSVLLNNPRPPTVTRESLSENVSGNISFCSRPISSSLIVIDMDIVIGEVGVNVSCWLTSVPDITTKGCGLDPGPITVQYYYNLW